MDRITRVCIKNIRAIESIDLEVSRPLTVLIGENGSGKSTIVECLELLHKAAEPRFMEQFYTIHRGMSGLLRNGANTLELGVVVEDDEGKLPSIDYQFALAKQGSGAIVHSEKMLVGPRYDAERPLVALRRIAMNGEMFDQKEGKLVPIPSEAMRSDQIVIGGFGNLPPQKAIERLLGALRGIEVHLGFETLGAWAARSYQRPVSIRGSTTHFPAARLELLGVNLANAWSELRGRETKHWEHTMALVRLGFGDRLDSILVTPDHGGGQIHLALRFNDVSEPLLADNLSDGQLAWLAFVAMTRLNPGRSFLAIDEPELHLHPALLGRVVSLMSSLDGGAPVLLSTHSDRVLEMLDNQSDAVRVCSLEGSKAVVSRIDAQELPSWLEQFGDLGQLRASGYLPRLLIPTSNEAAEPLEGGE